MPGPPAHPLILSRRKAAATPRRPRWPRRAAPPPPSRPAPAPPVALPAAPARSRCRASWVSRWQGGLGVPQRTRGAHPSPTPCQGPAPASGTRRAGCCTATPTSSTSGGSASPRPARVMASVPTASASPSPCSPPVDRSPSSRYGTVQWPAQRCHVPCR